MTAPAPSPFAICVEMLLRGGSVAECEACAAWRLLTAPEIDLVHSVSSTILACDPGRAAAILGRLGGLAGGAAGGAKAASKMTPEQRIARAHKAALARWKR